MAALTHHVMHCVTEALKQCSPMPKPKRQAGVQEPAIMTQVQEVIVLGVKLDVSESAFDVNFIDVWRPSKEGGASNGPRIAL